MTTPRRYTAEEALGTLRASFVQCLNEPVLRDEWSDRQARVTVQSVIDAIDKLDAIVRGANA